MSRYIKYFGTKTNHLLCGIKGVGGGGAFDKLQLSNKVGHPPFLLRFLDSLMIGNILAKFEKNLSSCFF